MLKACPYVLMEIWVALLFGYSRLYLDVVLLFGWWVFVVGWIMKQRQEAVASGAVLV